MLYSTTSHKLLLNIAEMLLSANQTLGVAESCTGGLLSSTCTELPGSSAWFDGGVVVYQNRLKEQLLGVPATLLKSDGAVSATVVSAMLRGAREAIGCDWSVAISGIAGPSGGSPEKPVGLVFLGVQGPHFDHVEKHIFSGDRQSVRHQAVESSLILLQKSLFLLKQ